MGLLVESQTQNNSTNKKAPLFFVCDFFSVVVFYLKFQQRLRFGLQFIEAAGFHTAFVLESDLATNGTPRRSCNLH